MEIDAEKETVKIGKEFAEALVSARYADAHSLLAEKLQRDYSPASLGAEYEDMVSYGEGQATVDGHHEFLGEWPDRQPDDIGWAYISISGEDYAEAVVVIVSNDAGLKKIREIEWGRP